MATVREYFDTDLKSLSIHKEWLKSNAGENQFSITAKIALDLDGNAKYWFFFIPKDVSIENVNEIFITPETSQCVLSTGEDSIYIESGFSDYSQRSTSETLVFTKRIFLYIDALLTPEIRQQITDLGMKQGFYVIVKDQEYAKERSEYEKPLAFISHDSRDKDPLVRELALELSKLMCPVWYDEYSLKVGDSLRACIEQGLKETKKCVIVLSPNFLSNDGWGKAEFDSIFTREIIEKNNIILPVWHNVGVKEVYQYSPRLADKVGLNSSIGVQELARKLSTVITQ
ncbi:TPA: TIR domain-containing protein [Legionella pneumophila]|nr:TIR domain-containing protein [Legionella pneumophila]